MKTSRLVAAALVLVSPAALQPALSQQGTAMTISSATHAGFERSLPFPDGFARLSARAVRVDGKAAELVRYERADGRNGGLGGEHVSLVLGKERLKGFARMDGSLRSGELPSQDESRAIAMAFLSSHAPDLLSRLQISFIAPHDEPVQLGGEPATLTGMKVKMRNLSDGRWFWVIVGADRQAMVFERDIVWANLQGRRQTEKWLHDSWLAENRPKMQGGA